MSWADGYIDLLKKTGQPVQFRPRGGSMSGRIESGQLVTVGPLTDVPKIGDIVLCRVHRNHFLHIVKNIRQNGGVTQYQIGNNRGGINGWINPVDIYGICIKIEK